LEASRKVFVTIPLMDELSNLPKLLSNLAVQTYKNFKVIFCVNQPEGYWDDPAKIKICTANLLSIEMLEKVTAFEIEIINRSSKGKGWFGKHFGVGWARKLAMDLAMTQAAAEDIIVTMDGDSEYDHGYLSAIVEAFVQNQAIKAISIPYYHKLTGNSAEDKAILRYEIYMRYYAINMLRIANPYAFTAIGSAIACTAKAYAGIRGLTPHKSGEDFYFIQKLRKYGPILIHLDACAFPAARFSDRVFFGTGPAMIRGNSGDWSPYPIYPFQFFDEVKQTFDGFEKLYDGDTDLPMSDFLTEKFGEDFWETIRNNVKTKQNFIRACWHKVDGLRILQYVKWRHQNRVYHDEAQLLTFFKTFYPSEGILNKVGGERFSFAKASIAQLDILRNFLMEKESLWQQKISVLR
jgi:glycosyltransferase involved in cell wall biosynthesis